MKAYQVTLLYTLESHHMTCKLYFNKPGGIQNSKLSATETKIRRNTRIGEKTYTANFEDAEPNSRKDFNDTLFECIGFNQIIYITQIHFT